MIGIVATLRVQPGKESDFEAVFLELAAKVRANESGNLLYQLTRSRIDPMVYKVLELYTDLSAVTVHGGSEYLRELGAKMGVLTTGRPELEYLDAID